MVGLECTHSVAACMNGIKTAGDLVMRLQLLKKMRINDAKSYIAKKLNISVDDVDDCSVMEEVREQFGIGLQRPLTGSPIGMEVKAKIAKVMDIPINSLNSSKSYID